VQRETGIAWSTLNSWANNQLTRYDAPVIMALCEYFDCQVGDLLVFEKEISAQ
jgi:putative transcriptional regulator